MTYYFLNNLNIIINVRKNLFILLSFKTPHDLVYLYHPDHLHLDYVFNL